ncbi:MAG: helix-turn-helix transcriptional regulator, partial [Candidatus Nanopelagicales bacterium]
MRTVIDDLTAAGSGTPVVICVDDVALLDDLTTFVVHQIVRRGAAKLVITMRAGDAVPDATQELLKTGQFEQLALQPLPREEAENLVADALGGCLEPESAGRLWALTQGNALYLRNIVESEVTEGRLVQDGGVWTWTGTPVMPPGLVEMVEARMGSLPAAVSDVVDILAVAEPLDIDLLASVTSTAAVEEAETRGLIALQTRNRDGIAVRLAHPLYGEVRRGRAARTRLRRLRGLVAERLVPAGDEDVHSVVRRSALRLESDLPADPQLLTAGAQGAISLADMALADRLADAAIRAGAGTEAYFVRSWALAWIS